MRLYILPDFDQDEQIGIEDLRRTILCLTREELTGEEVDFIAERVPYDFRIFTTTYVHIDTALSDKHVASTLQPPSLR